MAVVDVSKDPKMGLLLASLLLAASLYWLGDKVSFVLRAEEAEGVVVRSYSCSFLRRRAAPCGDVRYVAAGGSTAVATGVDAAGPPGSRVGILYDPETPDRAVIDGMGHWLPPAMVSAVLAVIVLSLGRKALAEES